MRISLHGAGIRLRGHKAEAFLFNTKFYNAHSTFRGSAAAVSEGAKLDVRSSWFGHNSGHWGGALYVATGGGAQRPHTFREQLCHSFWGRCRYHIEWDLRVRKLRATREFMCRHGRGYRGFVQRRARDLLQLLQGLARWRGRRRDLWVPFRSFNPVRP